MSEDNVGVALVKEACPLCAKLEDGPVILNSRLTKPAAENVRKLHGQTIGYMDKPCAECRDLMTKGILLIGVEEALTDDPKNPYRSGHQWVVTEDYIRRTFGDMADPVIKQGASFFSVEAARELGFPNTEPDASKNEK